MRIIDILKSVINCVFSQILDLHKGVPIHFHEVGVKNPFSSDTHEE